VPTVEISGDGQIGSGASVADEVESLRITYDVSEIAAGGIDGSIEEQAGDQLPGDPPLLDQVA